MDDNRTKILVIEDEEALRETMVYFLEDRDFNVLCAENGKLGLEVIERERPALVLTDLRMPEVGGLEVLSRTKELSPETPMIVVSGTGHIGDAVRALRLGAWDYVLKPVEDMNIILHAVERALERARLLRENREYQQELEDKVRERTHELEEANTRLANINVRLQRIVETTQGLAVCDQVDKFGARLLEEFASHMLASGGSIFLIEDLGLRRVHTLDDDHTPEFVPFPLPDGSVLQRLIQDREPLLVVDIAKEKGLVACGWEGYPNGSVLAFPLPNEDGEIVGALTLHSKTHPPFVEQDREIGAILASHSCQALRAIRAIDTLRQSEARFREMADMLPVAVFETNVDLKITYANQCAFDLLGYGEADLRQGLNVLDMVTPSERATAETNLAESVRGADVGMVEHSALRRDGTEFPVLVRVEPIQGKGGITGFRGAAVDISELRKAEEEKDRLEEQYRQAQKVEAIGRLAGGVAHDLNNLLSPILAYSDMIVEDFGDDLGLREYAGEILSAGERARDLVRQLLAFSRKQALSYRPLDMNKAILGFEKLLRRTLREDIELQTSLAPQLPAVNADIGQLEQVLMNLCVNAQDAMPRGGALVIETAVVELDEHYAANYPDAKPGSHVMLAASDTGCGMDDATRERIFEPFFSTKGEHGTGLGLATVYGIVKQHGGNIWVYSELGHGTTFKLYWPVAGEAPEESATELQPPKELGGSETILLVEDDEAVLNLALRILRRKGYALLPAKGGNEALAISESHSGPVHLLLSDVIMPGISGKELAENVTRRHPGARVLFMSGYTGGAIAQHGSLDEGVHLIQKPFTVQALAMRVRQVLDE